MSLKSRLNSLKSKIGGCVNDTAFWGTALLMTGFVATTPAFSQKMSLNTSGEWSVSRISAEPGQKSKPYCVMARRFDNDVIMSIAKNEDGQRSLAIDFQTPRLAVDRTYQVVLNAGGDVARGFEVRPVTDKAFVIRFGQDYKFFDAIEQGSFMKVSYSGEELSFDTQSFGESRKRLNECLNEKDSTFVMASDDSGVSSTEAKAVDVSYSDGAGQEVGNIEPASGGVEVANENITSASDQSQLIKELRQKVASLEAENEKLKVQKSERDSDLEKMSQLTDKVSSLKTALNSEKNRAGTLEMQLKDTEETAARYAGLLESARSDNEALERRLADVGNAGDKAIELEVRVNNLQAENSELKQRLASLTSSQVSMEAQEERVAGLRKLVVSMEDEITSLKKDKADLRDMLAETRSVIETSSGEANDNSDAVLSAGEMCLSSNNWNLERATRRYQEAQREIQRLGNALRRQKQECRSEIRSIEAQLFSPDMASSAQNERFIEMRQRMMQLTDQMKKQRVLSKRQIMRLEEELADASMKLERAEGRVREVQADLMGTKEALRTAKSKEMKLRSQVQAIKSERAKSYSTPQDDKNVSAAVDRAVSGVTDPASQSSSSQPEGLTGVSQDDKFATPNSRPYPLAPSGSQVKELPDTVVANLLTRDGLQTQTVVRFLDELQIDLAGDVMEFPVFGSADKITSYKWDTGSLLGGADLYKSLTADEFVARSRNACPGNFNMRKDYHAVSSDGDTSIDIYKISCDGDNKELTKSLVLVQAESGRLKVFSHEAHGDESTSLKSLHSKILSSLGRVSSS